MELQLSFVLWLQIHEAVLAGGKVLIPVFAVGRAQELLLLLDEFWERTQLTVSRTLTQPLLVPCRWQEESCRIDGGGRVYSAAFFHLSLMIQCCS